jgi:hypothetical protein
MAQIQEKAGKRLPDFEKALSHDDPEIVALKQQSEALATKYADAICSSLIWPCKSC